MRSRARFTSPFMALVFVFSFIACSVNVHKNNQGEDKNVDIDTPLGGIHVSNDADVRDTGLPVYPGARIKQKKDSADEKSANVNISAGGFGLKVVAIEYETDDVPAKVAAFYQEQMKKFGPVLQCHTSRHSSGYSGQGGHADRSEQLKCDDDGNGKNIELKVGTESNQHLVSIEPKDKGADFALVYVRTHGKEGSI